MKSPIKFKPTTLFLIPIALGVFTLSPIVQAGGATRPTPTPTTQDVNVVNTPTVNVANTTASQPFQTQVVGGFADGASTTGDISIATVPAGKLLVIEHVSVFGAMLPGQKMVRATIRGDVSTYLVISAQGSSADGSRDYFAANGPDRFVTQRLNIASASAERDFFAGANPDSVTFTIIGYFVDCPTCQ